MTRCFLRPLNYALGVLFSILLTPLVFSQTVTTGEVAGTTLDASGAVVIGASVLLKSVDTGESREVRSSASGTYRFAFVKPGRYEISGTSAGLKSDIGSFDVSVGQVQVLDLRLKPEVAKQAVLVTDAAPLLNTDNANIVYTLSTRQLDLLPLPGGDMVGVAYSVSGVVVNYRSFFRLWHLRLARHRRIVELIFKWNRRYGPVH